MFLQISKNNYAYISLKFPAEMSSSGSKTPVILFSHKLWLHWYIN